MHRQDRSCIPFEQHQKKAHQIYEKRIASGIDRSREEDWEEAKNELEKKRFLGIRNWRIQKFKALINGIWKFLTLPLWLFSKLPQLIAIPDHML